MTLLPVNKRAIIKRTERDTVLLVRHGFAWLFIGFSICDISLFIYQLTPSETRFTMFSLKSAFLIVEDAVNNNQKDKTRHSSFGKSWMFSCSKPISWLNICNILVCIYQLNSLFYFHYVITFRSFF